MLEVFALLLALIQSQEAAPATYIDGADVETTMNQSAANNRLDTKVKEAAVKGGIVRVGVVYRTKPEPRALLHNDLTEIYHIVKGSGTVLTGGTASDHSNVSDPANLGTTPTFYVTQTGGVSQKVKPNDMVIVPAGSPHRFTQLDGPISYVIYRFEPVAQSK
jgi:mannose-6-phosphate isomerase-like protein (cupin superfamily)